MCTLWQPHRQHHGEAVEDEDAYQLCPSPSVAPEHNVFRSKHQQTLIGVGTVCSLSTSRAVPKDVSHSKFQEHKQTATVLSR